MVFALNTGAVPQSPDFLTTYSDPVSPQDSAGIEIPIESSRKRLREQIAALEKQLDELPPFKLHPQHDQFGFHSTFLPVQPNAPEEPRWTLDFGSPWKNTAVLNIGMIPTQTIRDGTVRPFGFPKRFRIIGITEKGEPGSVLVDWSKKPFPDPDPFPVLFALPGNSPYYHLRLEVFEGVKEAGQEYFALGELICFTRKTKSYTEGISQSIRGKNLQNSLEQKPYWSYDYLQDGRIGLGNPLGAAIDTGPDMVFELERDPPPSVSLVFKFKKPGTVNSIDVFPAGTPDKSKVAGYGFPAGMQLELYRKWNPVANRPAELIRKMELPDITNPGDNYLHVQLGVIEAAGAKLTFDKFQVQQDKAIFALGEIRFGGNSRELPTEVLPGSGLPPGEEKRIQRLTDGVTQGRSIISKGQWIRMLAYRKAIQFHLDSAMQELERRNQNMVRNWIVAASVIGGGLILFLASFAVYQRRTARKKEERLRTRLASDLHDDVGALLGCSMLAGKKLERLVSDEKAHYEVQRILNSTTKAIQALRDIVWFTNQEQDTVQHLIAKMNELVDLYSKDYRISLTIRNLQNPVDFRLDLAGKRNIFLLVKEALNNINKHAHAEKVDLSIGVQEKKLRIRIKDDGVGFDLPSAENACGSAGFGLKSMKTRAKRMNASLTINTKKGQGTDLLLEVPLKLYKTQAGI